MEMMAKGDDTLREHLENGRKNAQYTSEIIQTEVIDVVAEYIRKKKHETLKTKMLYFPSFQMRSHIHMVTRRLCQCA